MIPILSLACGLIIDSCRYLLTLLPRLFKSYRTWNKYDISKANEDDRKYHDWIIENNYRFHQFYGNLSLALLFSTIILQVNSTIAYGYIVTLFIISTITAISAVFTFITTIQSLKKRFNT